MAVASPPPPRIQAAVTQLARAIASVEGTEIDPLTASWPTIESAVIKLLRGAFSPDDPTHRSVAFMLGAMLAERVRRDLGAFWFQSRAAPHGAALGFPFGIVVFSPFEAALRALGRSRLSTLEDLTGELRGVLAQARAQIPPGQDGESLGPEDYGRLFDPGFVQFVALDPTALEGALAARPDELARQLEHAFSRLPAEVPDRVREPTRRRILDAIGQLDPLRPLSAQAAGASQLAELVALVLSGRRETGFAPEELWAEVLLPLCHIGASETFPELDEDEIAAFREGTDPLVLYVDTVPYQVPAGDEDGLLGTFPDEQVAMLDPAFDGADGLRLLRLAPETLRPLCERVDAPALRDAVERFRAHAEAAAGPAPAAAALPDGVPTLFDVALTLLGDTARLMKEVDEQKLILCVRHATESEVASEPVLRALRAAHAAPRIILA